MTSPAAPAPAAIADCISDFARAQSTIRLMFFDFDGVFTDNQVFVFEDGREAVRCSRFDGLGLRRLEQVGIRSCILSTEANPVVTARARKLKIDCRQSLEDKVAAARDEAESRGLDLSACGFVGNDINDIPLLREVGLALGVADSHEAVYPHVCWLTRRAGGWGAVREVCDAIADLRMNMAGDRATDAARQGATGQ